MELPNSYWLAGAAQVTRLFLMSSRNVTAPFDGYMMLRGAGGGATGARATAPANATGASGSEYVLDIVQVAAGDSFVVTIGAGASPAAANSNGNNGGDTTITNSFTSYSLTIKGGGAGQYVASGVAAGGVCPTGSGGSSRVVRHPGGSGGGITGAGTTSKKTGGGAVNIFGLPAADVAGGQMRRIDATARATGGGGVGGKGGTILTTGTALSGGGGAGGPGVDDSLTAGRNLFQELVPTAPLGFLGYNFLSLPFNCASGGSNGASPSSQTEAGGGTGASTTTSGAPGPLGGSGAGDISGATSFGGGTGGHTSAGNRAGGGFVDITFVRKV